MTDAPSVLERSLLPALEGDRTAAQAFFEAFLRDPLVVPERRQAQKMSDEPRYPNEFLNILGVQAKERVLVPVFSRRDLIVEWCGSELATRSISGAELLTLMPEEWWICLNPGAEIEKEISPWEIEQLKEGTAGIPAVLDEIYQDTIVEPLEVQAVNAEEYPSLQRELRIFAEKNSAICKMYLIRQSGKDAEEALINKLLLGLEISAANEAEVDRIKAEAQNVSDRCQVGNDKVSVFTAISGQGDMSFGLFGKSTPFYTNSSATKPKNLLAKLFGR
ncbi:MAG: SseB family protein [Deltaproteobacteria bacterium]|nr:SseB family protein [Deltaproteobacteria bacterium]